MKICSKCGVNKSLNEFNKRSNSKDGFRFECRLCQKSHYEVNRDHYINKMKTNRINKIYDYKKKESEYYIKNKIEILKKKQQYHIDNRQILLDKTKEYYNKNKEKRSIYIRKWVKDNIVYYREYQKEYSKQYRKNNPHIILWRSVLNSALIRLGKSKECHTIDLLGYSPLHLKEHLETLFTEGMSWDNHGEWHIDHIKPVTKFDKNTPMDIVNALSNLQPL